MCAFHLCSREYRSALPWQLFSDMDLPCTRFHGHMFREMDGKCFFFQIVVHARLEHGAETLILRNDMTSVAKYVRL